MPFDPNAYIGTSQEEKTSTFDPDAYLGRTAGSPPAVEPGAGEQMYGLAAPAVTGFGMSGQGLNPAAIYEQGIKPFAQAGVGTLKKYVESPLKAGVDVAAMMMGSPVPPVGTIEMGKTLKNVYGAGQEVISNISEALGKLPKGIDVEAATMLQGLSPTDQARLASEIQQKGLERGFKEFAAPEYLDEAGRASLRAVQESFPSGITKLGRAIAPVARTAARVAGPAGMAYDIYEAYPYYQQANVPERLASGEVKQTMQGARRAMLNAPTAAPLSSQEAENLYSSGDQRLIDIYKNDAALKELIRRKAAERVLGPVAP